MSGPWGVAVWAVLGFVAVPLPTARLSTATAEAFQKYVTGVEARIAKQHTASSTYVTSLQRHEVTQQLRSGSLFIEPVNGGTMQVRGGQVHHWRGSAFVAGAKAADMLALLRSYADLPKYYTPEMERCVVLANSGDSVKLAIRIKKQKINTVIFDGEFDVKTALTNQNSGYEISRSLHIWQVEDPGTPSEKRDPEGKDNGLLWRLYTYWSFIEVDGGLVMECEAVTLTRDVPFGAGWVMTPIVSDLAKGSLTFTLTATKRAMVERSRK